MSLATFHVDVALGEEHLSALEGAGEGRPVRDESPTANVQVLWLDVLQSHEAVNACGGRVRCAGGGEGDDGGEFGEGHEKFKPFYSYSTA